MFVDFNILNQLGSPSINSNTFANRPAAGQTGRLFVSIDTFELYRDTGSGWDLIGGPGSSTVVGSGSPGQVTFWDGSNSITGENNLFWDSANNHLGINTSTPGSALDIHSSADVGIQLNGTGGTPNIYIDFLQTGTSQYRLGYTDGAVDNRRFSIYDVTGSKEVLTIDKQSRYVGINYQYTSLTDQPAYEFDVDGSIRAIDYLLADNSINVKKGTSSSTPNGYSGFYASSATNSVNFRDGSNGNSFWFIFPTGISQLTIPNASGTLALLSDIPSLAGYVPTSRTITINGTNYDLTANRSWSVGTVTGTGTTNYLSRWNSTSDLSTSLVYDNGSNLVKTVYSGNDKGINLDFANSIYQIGNLNNFGLVINDSVNKGVSIGDISNLNNKTYIDIADYLYQIYFYGNNKQALNFDFFNNLYSLGDLNNYGGLLIGAGSVHIGDVNGNINPTRFIVDYASNTIYSQDKGLQLDIGNQIYTIGDYQNNYGQTKLIVDDTSTVIKTEFGGSQFGFYTKQSDRTIIGIDGTEFFGIDHINAELICKNLDVNTSSGPAGIYLRINVNGTAYVIPLDLP